MYKQKQNSWMLILVGLLLPLLLQCTKGKSSINAAKEGVNYVGTAGNYTDKYAPNDSLKDPIEFYVKTKLGRPLPDVKTEFRAFNITAADTAGVAVDVVAAAMAAGWDSNDFTIDETGTLTSKPCADSYERDLCSGALSGGSTVTNTEGKATVGLRTANAPSAVLGIAMKVPKDSTAANLIQFVKIRLASNDEFAKSGRTKIQPALIVIPPLFNDAGMRIIKAGSSFNIAIFARGVPNTEFGKGYSFDFETTGLKDIVDGVNVVVPSGTKKCDFYNDQCILPGGPFKISRPTNIKITVKPTDPAFPVAPVSLEIPVETGSAKNLVLSLTPQNVGINNICVNPQDISKPCFEVSADIASLDLYPALVDEGGNFVSSSATTWSVTGPLLGRLAGTTVPGKQVVSPLTAGQGLITVYADQFPGVSTSITYVVRSGVPVSLSARSEHSVGAVSPEKATVPFKAKVSLFDAKDNLCIDFTGNIGVRLKLDQTYPSTVTTGVKLTSVLSDVIDNMTTLLPITRGEGVTPGTFNVIKVPDVGAAQVRPKIVVDASTTSLATKSPVYIDVTAGPPVQGVLRNSGSNVGVLWSTFKAATSPYDYEMATDKQFFFYNAGFDSGGNYTGDLPSNFWGVAYTYNDWNDSTNVEDAAGRTAVDDLATFLRGYDPSFYGIAGTCPDPDLSPVVGGTFPTNQPLSNKVFCGLHRGLVVKSGSSTVYASAGIPGSGRMIAIPADSTIAAAITPILTIVSGTATKFAFELVQAGTSTTITLPIAAGVLFNLKVHAQDNNNLDTPGYAGVKDFNVVSTNAGSWAGVLPNLPNGTVSCTFTAGVCTLGTTVSTVFTPGTYVTTDSRQATSVTIEQTTAGGITGPWSKLITTSPGAEKVLVFASKKGGPTAIIPAISLTSVADPLGYAITTDQDLPFAIAVTDAAGNYLRDANNSTDGLVFEGFQSTTGDISSVFNSTTFQWTPADWTILNPVHNLFVANASPTDGLPVTPKKFYDPAVGGDVASISVPNQDSTKYNTVFVPQNRIGRGYAVVRSSTNPLLIGWPSPWIKVSAGAVEHSEHRTYSNLIPARDNTNIQAGECNTMRVFIHDKKHNQIIDYTTVSSVTLKLFKSTAAKPNGIDDIHAGDFTYTNSVKTETANAQVRYILHEFYNNLNAPEVPGPQHNSFAFPGATNYWNGGTPLSSTNGPNADRLADMWNGNTSIVGGEIILPGTICLHPAQYLSTYGGSSVSAPSYLQVELAQNTIDGITYAPLTSRGSGVQFIGQSGATIGSTATAHTIPDALIVNRRAADHLHPTMVDSIVGASFLGSWTSAGDIRIGVETPCPYMTCGPTDIYFHVHDSAHNFIKPASPDGFRLDLLQTGPEYSEHGKSPTVGALGSAALRVFGGTASTRTITEELASLPMGVENNELPSHWVYPSVGNPTRVYGGSTAVGLAPGAPHHLGLTVESPLGFNTDNPFGMTLSLYDQYNNLVYGGMGCGAGSGYIACRTINAWWTAQPSNAPNGDVPLLMGQSGTHNSLATAVATPMSSKISGVIQSGSFLSRFAFSDTLATEKTLLVNAGVASVLNIQVKDTAASGWCAAGHCASGTGPQTFSMTYTFLPPPGPTTSLRIQNLATNSGVPYTSTNYGGGAVAGLFNTNPGAFLIYPMAPDLDRKITAYACELDSRQNVTKCQDPTDFSFTSTSTADVLVATGSMTGASSLEFFPNLSGVATITASRQINGSTMTANSDPINVAVGLLSDFTLVDDSPTVSPSVAAGSVQTLTLCKKDNADHVIAVPASSTMTINVNNIGAGTNSEGSSILLSTATGAGFDAATFTPGPKSLTFVNGCVTLYAKILIAGTFNDGPILGLTYTDPTQSNRLIQGAGLTVGTVTPSAIDHYVTIPDSLTAQAWNVVGSSNTAAPAGNRFGVTVYARDLYGNTVVAPASTTVTLSLARNSSGVAAAAGLDLTCAAPANGAACLTVNMSSLPSVAVSNLASQIGGTFYIAASDGTRTFNVPKSTPISLVTSGLTVASYGFSLGAATAGTTTSAIIYANDASGATVTGADALLDSLTYSLVDGSAALLSTHVAPDGSLPVISGPSSFSQGTAVFSITYTKAETGLVLNVKDNQSPLIQSANATGITVTAGTLLKYAVTCTMVTGGADCTGASGSPYSLNASQSAKYNLKINAYDTYKNPKIGEFSVPVRITRTGGSAVAYTDPSNTTKKGELEQYPGTDAQNTADYFLVNASSTAGVTLGNIFYRSGNVDLTMDIDPTGSAMASMYNSTYHRYLPHKDMVTEYRARNLDLSPVSGVADTFTLAAVDHAGNLAKGVEADLNGQTFAWTGPLSSPSGDVPVLPSSALTFTNGETGNLSVTHYNSGDISFSATDNFVPSVIIPFASYRNSTDIVAVSTALANRYSVNVATGFTTTPLAGQSQDVTVTAQDIYNNPMTTWASDTLTFAWTPGGGSPSITNPKTPGVSTATVLASGSRSFTSGVYQTTGTPFTLYRSNLTALTPKEVSTLTVTGTTTAGTRLSTALTGALSFTTSPADSFGYVRIGTSSTYSVVTDISGAAVTATTDQTKSYYGHLFDMYGNSKGNLNPVDWSGTDVLAGKFNGASGTNTLMSPTQIGTGVITASCTSVDAGCLPDSSGTVTITGGLLSDFTLVDDSPAANPSVAAGSEQTLTLCKKDNADHVIAVPASWTTTININNIGAGTNSEGNSILLSTATGAGFDAATFNPGAKSLTFVNGCVTLYAKILVAGTFNDSPILGLTYTDPTQSNRYIQGSGLTVGTVTPLAIAYYVTIPGSDSAQAWSVVGSINTAAPAGNRFGVTVYARDLYGNTVVAPASTTVTLSLATNSGGTAAAAGLDLTCAAPANGAACLTIDMSSLSSVVVANLASQIGGTFYIAASDGTSTVSVPKSTSISLVTSQLTVASYGISPSSATAGDLRSISIAAKDASGATVTGADSLLNSLTYSLVDGSGAVLSAHVAPDGSLPVISGPSSFSQGTADFSITYTKAETGLVLNVKDNQSTIIQSANATPITVTAGTLLKYAVTCTMVTGGTDCTGTSGSPYALNASQTAKYNLTINAYDIYKNPKAGEFSVPVRITRTGGSAVAYWDPSNTTKKGELEQYPQVDPRNVSSNYLVNTSPAAGVTLGNIFYRSGNVDLTIDIDPTLSTMTSMHNSTYHRYLPHIDMVTDYYLRNLDSTPVAGLADIFTLKAVDRAGNLAKGVETDLNGLTFTWTGPLSSPRADVPVLPSSALTFTNGETGDLSVTHYKSGSGINFRVKDNFVPSVSISGGSSTYRDGYEYVSVSTAPGHHYSVNVATGFTTTPLAGQSQDVKVTAQDIYNNPITTWPSDTLSFAWTAGGSPSVTNPKTAGVSTATVLDSGSRSFTSGVYQTTGTPFTLYRSHLTALTPKEVSTLTVTGTITAGTVSSTALTGALSFTTSPATSSGYVRIGTSSTYSVGTDISGAAVTATTDQTKIYYGHLFDMYGNSKGNLNPVDWSGTDVLAGKFNGASGANTEMSPTQIGTGVITASCTSVDAGCLPDSSGTATITVGGINKIVFIAPGLTADFTQTSVTCQQLTTQLQDRNNNPVPVSGNTTIAFASTAGNGEFYASSAECTTAQTGGDGASVNTGTYNASTLTGSAASRSATITTGNSSIAVWYANRTTVAANGVTITAINGSWTATLHATITADVTKRFAFTSSALNINAWTSPTNTCGLVTYKFQDKWLNNSTSTASSTVNLSSNSGTGSFYSDSGCSTLITSGIRTVATSSANDTVYYKDTQANNATMSLLATSTLSGNTALQVQTLGATVSPGPFGLTNSPVASASNVKDTVTVNWTASPGARDYTVSFGISNTCGTELSPTTSTAANITTGRNALTYICVRANGYTGSPGMPQLAAMTNIANTGTPFYLWIDNTIPTATITQPATNGAFIGPVTAATVSASNTTFTGTALDTSGSGVSTVQVKLQRGSDTKYWDGSNWVASSTLLSATNTGTTYSTWNYVITNANMDLGGDAIAYTLTTVVTDMSGNIASTAATKAFTWRNSAATVSNVTSTTVSGSYKASVVIPVTVTFNKIQIVNVTGGTPTLAMGPGTSATYVSGSGSAALIFNYIVVAGQTSADLDYATTGALTLNGGTIKDQAENVSTLTLATPGLPGSLGANSAIVIDTTPATVTNVTSSTADAVKGIDATVSIQVVFSELVNVAGTPVLTLSTGAAVNYASGTGTNTLTFTYTVGTGQNSADLDYQSTTALTAGTSINDAASNVSTLTLPALAAAGSLSNNKALVIDGTRATVTGVATSTANGNYKSGQVIPITVTFSENVTVTGTPQLVLNSGTTVNYTSGSGGTALLFNYTVASSTNVAVLDYSATGSLGLNAGTINDVGANTSTLTLPTLNGGSSITGASGTTKLIKIDTTNATAAITAPASGVTYIGPVTAATASGGNTTFTGTAADAGSGVSSVQVILQRLSDNYYWDGSTWVFGSTLLAATGTTSWTYVITNTNMNLAADNTQYTLTTTVTDVVGNIGSAVATKTFTWRNTAATVSSVSSSSSDVGKYTTGGIIAVTVTFNKNVIVTGTPQIAMATGGVAYCVAAAAATVVTCNYTVGANQNSTDLDYASTGALALNGGTIKDQAENVSTLTLATPGAANSLGSNKNFVIDTMAPTVTDVNSSTTDGIIGFNGTVSIQVTFSENVTVTNTPTLALNSGGTASYASGSGTNVLTFANTVGATNASADLNYSATNSLAGTIKDAATNAANLTLPALAGGTSLAGHKALVIDGIAATVTGVTTTLAAGSYKLNQIIPITVTFLENVTVTGTPTLLLNSSATPVNYFSGSGTTALVFNYTVGANDTQATKLDYSATNSLALNTGTILDVAGNTSTLTLPALNLGGSITGASGTAKIIKIDTTAPTVTGVTSSTANGSYKVGSPAVAVTVTFSEIVNVVGTPQLTLENGGSGAVVNYVSGTGTATLTFNYTIGAGDTSADLDFQSTSALALNGGTILDAALNAATLTLVAPGAVGSLANLKTIVIDTTAPTLVFSSGLPGAESKSTTLNIAILTTDTNTYSYAVTSGACAGATYTSGVAVATNITSSITGLSDGNVTVCAQATDLAGNTQATYTSYTWIKDIVAPALFTITAPTGQGSTTSPTVTWTTPATDVYKIDMTVSKTSGCATNIEESYLSSEIASNAASKAIVATLPNGTYYVCMYVYDVSLNKSAVITGSFEIETDIIHVSWTETTNDIRYGFKNQAAAWAVETVETSANTYNSRTSLAIDNAGLPYISYSVNDGTNTYMQYRKRTATNDWTTTYSQNSAANATMAGIGSFNEMAISAASTVYSSFFGYNGSIGGLSLGTDAASSTPTITDTLATNFTDMAVAVGTSGSQYQVVSQLVSAKYVLKIINAGTNLSGTVTLPTNCDQAPYVSAFAKTSDTVIGLATVCVMSNDNTCHAYYGEATYTGSGANFIYSAWTDIGTVKAATCVLGDLSESDRPSIVYDRQNSNKVSVAWRDQVNNQIKRWTNESGSNANETVLTGSGTIGQQTIALDALGKSYIVYQDGDSVRFVTNNSRVVGNYTGGWSTPAVIATGTTITGIGSVGITGMKGRGNTTNGQ